MKRVQSPNRFTGGSQPINCSRRVKYARHPAIAYFSGIHRWNCPTSASMPISGAGGSSGTLMQANPRV